jgi:hypothetical protein
MKRALIAVLAFFVVGSALGESPQPAKIRITTWNLEWFPNGSAHEATLEKQAQRIEAAADVLGNWIPILHCFKRCAITTLASDGSIQLIR